MNGNTLTIITVHLNDFEGLQGTLDSLQTTLQKGGVEWVVVDGGSNPGSGTQEAVLRRAEEIADIYVSEPDDGIYFGMNKGTTLAGGDYLLYLNAGDRLHPDFSLDEARQAVEGTQPEMLWGCYDECGKPNQLENIAPRGVSWLWWGMPTSHQAILFRREKVDNQPYDTSLRIAADYDLVLRLARNTDRILISDQQICIADATGVSNRQLKAAFKEQMQVRHRHYGTSKPVNLVICAAKIFIGYLGRLTFLRKTWKKR